MSNKTAKVPRNKYDVFTEACPKMTRRWRRDVIPELAAWLTLQRVRVERQKLHAAEVVKAGGGAEMREALQRLQVRIDILRDLTRQLGDKWNDYLWWEVAGDVDELLGPIPAKPNFNPGIPGMVAATVEPLTDAADGTGRRDASAHRPPGHSAAVKRGAAPRSRGNQPGATAPGDDGPGTGRGVPTRK